MSAEGVEGGGGQVGYRQSSFAIVAAWLTLADGAYRLLHLPFAIMADLAGQGPSPIVLPGFPLYAGWAIGLLHGVGLLAAGYGLLRIRSRVLGAGLVLLVPALVGRLLRIPGLVMLATGRVSIDLSAFSHHPPSPHTLDALHSVMPWANGAVIALYLLSAVYFLWLAREWVRMRAK